MAKPKYRWIPIFNSWQQDFADLTVEERGLLYSALLDYYNTGKAKLPRPYLTTVFRCMKREIDNWFADHLEELEANNWYDDEEE